MRTNGAFQLLLGLIVGVVGLIRSMKIWALNGDVIEK